MGNIAMTTLTQCQCDNDKVIQPFATLTIGLTQAGGIMSYDLCDHCTALFYAALPGLKPPTPRPTFPSTLVTGP
jgi:hypothetical protein